MTLQGHPRSFNLSQSAYETETLLVINSKLGLILPHFRDILEILYAESHIFHTHVNPTHIPVKISGCKNSLWSRSIMLERTPLTVSK